MEETRVPVYLITGFLESGKTSFLSFTLQQDYFQIDGKTLLILCEEGKTGRLGRGAAYHLCGCKHIPSLYGEYEVPFYGHGPQCGYGYL